ncbi:MAG: hypothetical protein JXA90_17160, partial [Planctomycetes bacterium]|nr:hypothetical protein [Planctomycetota bacterium]
ITDLFDATDIAVCRMYRSAGEVWRGLAKNATEGLGHPAAIVPWTVILGAGQVLPPALLGIAVARWLAGAAGAGTEAAGALVAASLSILPRWAAVFLFRQSPLGALLHPLGVLVLLAIQWYALARSAIGLPAGWKGRGYGRSTSAASDVAQESPSDG